MGYAMASNIRKKIPSESILYINDINLSTCERFKAEYNSHGPIEIVSTAREAAENSKVLISIVPGAVDVKKVFLDERDGVIASRLDVERVMCECSTIDVKSTQEIGEALMKKGLGTYVDTPVSVRFPIIYPYSLRPNEMVRVAYQQPSVATSACSSDTQHLPLHRPTLNA